MAVKDSAACVGNRRLSDGHQLAVVQRADEVGRVLCNNHVHSFQAGTFILELRAPAILSGAQW